MVDRHDDDRDHQRQRHPLQRPHHPQVQEADTNHSRNHTQSDKTRGPRKPYVRLVTDKRREQNRRAQKAYRERLKKKLEVLEEQAASTLSHPGQHQQTPRRPSHELIEISGTETHIQDDEDGQGTVNVDLVSPALSSPAKIPHRATGPTGSGPRVINLAEAFVAAGDLPFGQGALPGIQLQVGPDTPATVTDIDEIIDHTHDDYGDIDLRQIWAMPHGPAPSQPSHQHHPGISRGSTTLMTLTPQRSPNGLQFFTPKLTVADPYMNHLHLVGEGNVEASLAVALSIGISRSQYLNDHPSHFPGCYVALNKPDPSSPTNSSSPVTVSYKFAHTFMNVTPELQEHLESVKPPMRPTPAQLLNPHPSYLDCLVFPYFRDHAVQASVDGILDHAELFMDLMHGGLVCWGGMSGLTNRHGKSVKSGKRGMSDSVAWNTRSWEAKRWFLKKWTWLVGTEEEEEARGDVDGIWRGSRWWWAMRGEDDTDEEMEETDFGGARVSEIDSASHCV
ncbi:uncharacterized protein PV07_07321 [Cladophialophora immunda]|uniref:BZIP domain-containing protein n=1 Tax=Cladophialophora immunda TaxID=569365 RepID=A0A0D2AR87_9EURO|nr:uncharacterized protein PV07_07321 [Cladophialophora immunda]KIW27592.1 hypothetical protein PV07_07321 [Cladophialophora immunda]OQU97360.1 hypothetical protein CLAIMM_03298 [Cladophialophora immunda]